MSTWITDYHTNFHAKSITVYSVLGGKDQIEGGYYSGHFGLKKIEMNITVYMLFATGGEV